MSMAKVSVKVGTVVERYPYIYKIMAIADDGEVTLEDQDDRTEVVMYEHELREKCSVVKESPRCKSLFLGLVCESWKGHPVKHPGHHFASTVDNGKRMFVQWHELIEPEDCDNFHE